MTNNNNTNCAVEFDFYANPNTTIEDHLKTCTRMVYEALNDGVVPITTNLAKDYISRHGTRKSVRSMAYVLAEGTQVKLAVSHNAFDLATNLNWFKANGYELAVLIDPYADSWMLGFIKTNNKFGSNLNNTIIRSLCELMAA